jgi:hypothetical protein
MLQSVVPRATYRPQLWSTNYQPPVICSLLGIPLTVAIPSPTPSNVLCLDVIQGKGDASKENSFVIFGEKMEFSVRPGGSKSPTKCKKMF